MLHTLPKHMPPLSVMLADISNPNPTDLAKALGVSRRTVYRWIAADAAPRCVLLAIFWMTRWGVSQIHCQAHNDAIQQASIAVSMKAALDAALARVSYLQRIGDFGTANEPMPADDNRQSLGILGDAANAVLTRSKTHWIGGDITRPEVKAAPRIKRKRA